MTSITLMPANAQLSLELDECYVYKFDHRVRTDITNGPCQIYENQVSSETPQEKLFYVRVNDFFQILKKQTVMIRRKYATTMCYLFETSEKWICCLSFDREDKNIENFETTMGQFLYIVDLEATMIDPTLRERIQLACPLSLQTAQDISFDLKRKLKHVGCNIGYATGVVSKIVTGQSAKNTASALSERVNRFSQETISDNAKQKWSKVKQTSGAINDMLTPIFKPVINLYNYTADKIGGAFYNSENQVIKTIREYSHVIEQSLNNGVKKGFGPQENEYKLKTEEASTISLR